MSELIVTWHDWVRLTLYVSQILIALTIVRLIITRMRWRSFWSDPDLWVYLALVLLLFTSIRSRAAALGTGEFPEGWPTILVVLATLFVMVWLALRVKVTIPWLRPGARARRGRARAQRQAETRVDRRRHRR